MHRQISSEKDGMLSDEATVAYERLEAGEVRGRAVVVPQPV
jgi:hypothetical protein